MEKKVEESITKELTQLHNMTTFIPLDPSSMTKEQFTLNIKLLIFLTEKRNGNIKGLACDNFSKQQFCISKEYTAYSKSSTEAVDCGKLQDKGV